MIVEEFIAARLAEDGYATGSDPVQTAALGAIAEIHFNAGPSWGNTRYCDVCHDYERHDAAPWPCATILAVASYWSHHPDYQWGERA